MTSRTAWSRVARLSAPPPRLVLVAALGGRAPAARPLFTPGPSYVRPLLSSFRYTHDTSRSSSSSSASSPSPASASASASSPASPSTPASPSSSNAADAGLAPHYELTFTCVPCDTRSAHKVSKQGYHYGSVLITCPSCRNRHVISDHLGIFGTAEGEPRTVEDILKAQGRLVKKGTLGEDGDLEFWEDGSSNSRQTRLESEDVLLPATNKKPAEDDAAPGSTFVKG